MFGNRDNFLSVALSAGKDKYKRREKASRVLKMAARAMRRES